MKISVLNKLLREKGWQIIQQHESHYSLGHAVKSQVPCFIIPASSTEQVPIGTLNAILRSAGKTGINHHWTSSIRQLNELSVVLEKHGKFIWGRIEVAGLLAATRGSSIDEVIDTLRTLLINCASDENTCYRSLFESIIFEPVYDTTAVWDLFRQVKANHIAGNAGIDIESISRFMAGSTFPSVEQAERLEASIRALGRQLMQVSIR